MPFFPVSLSELFALRWRRRVFFCLLLLLAPSLLLIGAIIVCPSGQCGLPATDQAVMRWASTLREPWLDEVMRRITWAGSLLVLVPIAFLQAYRCFKQLGWLKALWAPVAIVGATGIAQAFKWWLDRPRPQELPVIDLPIDPSFPSAHTMQITALVFTLLWIGRTRAYGLWMVAIVLIVLVGFSRIYLGVHFFTDVLLGAAAGLAWAWALRYIYQGEGEIR